MATATVERVQTNGNGKSNGRNGSNGHGSNGHGNGKANRLTAAECELRIQQFEKRKAAAKELYDEADRLERELIEALGDGGSLSLTDGRTCRVVNNFIDASGRPKAKHYGLAGVRILELKIK